MAHLCDIHFKQLDGKTPQIKCDESKTLPWPLGRSSFKDPRKKGSATCACHYWKKKYEMQHEREHSQIGMCCQQTENEKPCQASCPPCELCCKPSSEKTNEEAGTECEAKKNCEGSEGKSKLEKNCGRSKTSSKISSSSKTPGKVVLNFNVNLTSELKEILEKMVQ